MPAWLRSAPHSSVEATSDPQLVPGEFVTILSDEDIPLWLKRMAERHAAEQAPAAVATEPPASAVAASPVPPTPSAVAAPIPVSARVDERRVRVGAPLPPTIDPTPSLHRPRTRRLPAVENRTAIGVAILAVIAALVILAIVLVG